MALYTLTFDVLGVFGGAIPKLSVIYGGTKIGMSYAYAGSSTMSFQIDTDSQPFDHTLLRFYFVKSSGTDGDEVQLSNIQIDGNVLDTNDFTTTTGGSVSGDTVTLSQGGYSDYNAAADLSDTQIGAPGGDAPLATITGTAGDDIKLYGTNEAGGDTIDALGGNDYVIAGDGDDTVNAGTGDDKVIGGEGNDILNGDAGNDRMSGGIGNDTLNGGGDDDRLYGQDGDDTMNGDAGSDALYGGNGADIMSGGTGNDRVGGNAGNDTINGDDGDDQLFGNDGVDTIRGGNDNDRILGGNDGDFLYGDAGDDNIDGQNGNDRLEGGTGADTLDGEYGNDTILGDAGNDFVIGGQGADTVRGGADNDIIYGGGIDSYDQYVFRTAAVGGRSTVFFSEQTQSFYQYVNSAVNYATAEAAAQATLVNGVGGHLVTIDTQIENDFIQNIVGSDVWIGATDSETEGQWTWNGGVQDGIQFSNSSGTSVNNMYENWNGGEPNDSGGEDAVELRNSDGLWNDQDVSSSNHYVIEWDATDVQAENSNDFVYGDAGDDILYGGGGNDRLEGGTENDILYGEAGADTMLGDEGNDTLYGGAGGDNMLGGDGNDVLHGDDVTQVIGQSGQVTTNQTGSAQWHTITFDATILNPVIKLAMNTTNDTDPTTLRVRNVTDTGFQWQIDEYEYLDGVHGSETVSWMAVAQGTHTLDDGTIIQANTTTATNNNWTNVTFNSAFGSSPVIMTQIMTVNEGTAAVLHNENRTSTGFRLQIEEQENFGTAHATETIGWIAIDNGGSVANGFLVGETSNSVTHSTTTVNFGSSFASNTPVVLIDQQTEDGGDTALSRGITISSSSISFNIDEETSRDAETSHITEVVGYYATTNGLIYADGSNGNDSLSGGDGLDTLYGGDGADTFVFEAASAYNDIDQIEDFRYGQGDALDISDLLTGFSGTITDYVNFVDSGSDMLVQVDGNGLTGGTSFTTIGQLNNVTNLDEALLYAAGGIIV